MRSKAQLIVVLAVILTALVPARASRTTEPQASVRAPAGRASLWGVPLEGSLLTRPLCSQPANVPALGPVCPAPNGMQQVLFGDGTSGLTHGPDMVGIHQMDQFLDVKARKPDCVNRPATDYHVQMIYARASNKPDRYTALLSKMRNIVYRVNGMLYREGAELGRKQLYRMACSGSDVSIRRVKLPITHAQVEYSSVVTGVRDAGYTSTLAKYWIFYDGQIPGAPQVGGTAILLPDDALSDQNLNNFGPSYGVFFGRTDAFGIEALMHEAAHSLGAIQDSAPNASGFGHCIDDSDVMCYPENESVRARFKISVCRTLHFDCRHNDYYHPRPSSSNYLATHWNLGSPLNRFFSGCDYETGSLTVGAPGAVDPDPTLAGVVPDWEPIAARTHSISSSCAGHRYALYGSVPPPTAGTAPYPTQAEAAGGVNDYVAGGLGMATAQPVDLNVCFYRGTRRLSCAEAVGTDLGTVPAGTTRARVFLNAGAKATYVLSII